MTNPPEKAAITVTPDQESQLERLMRRYRRLDRVRSVMTIDYITSDVTIKEGSLGSIEEDCQGLCRVIWDDHPEIVLPTSGDVIVQVPLLS